MRKTVLLTVAIAVGALFWFMRARTITGYVEDPFGKPLPGVAVTIEQSGFASTTGHGGRFALDYAPGSFTVIFKKDGFTTMSLPLSISEKTDYPAPKLVLYPLPGHEVVSFLGAGGATTVAATLVRTVQTNVNFFGSRVRNYVDASDGLVVPSGQLVFLDTRKEKLVLARAKEDGLISDNQASEAENQYLIVPPAPETVERIGVEGIRRHTVTLNAGRYAWIELIDDPYWGVRRIGKFAWSFHVGPQPARTAEYEKKVRATLANIATIGAALDIYHGAPIPSGPMTRVAAFLTPYYLEACPVNDAWGEEIVYTAGPPGLYSLVSGGPDRHIESYSVNPWTWDEAVPRRTTTDPSADIVYYKSIFAQRPALIKSEYPGR